MPETVVGFRPDVGADKGYPQHGFLMSEADMAGYFGGLGSGKTTILVVDAVSYAMSPENVGSIQIFTEPTHQMLKDVAVPKINQMFGSVRGREFTMTETAPLDMKFRNGSQIWLRSTEMGEHLYGAEVARVLMDEVTLGNQEGAFEILLGRRRQQWASEEARGAGLVPFRRQIKVAGTPKGRNWVWRRFVYEPVGNVEHFLAGTQDNLHLPSTFLPQLLTAYGGWDSPQAQQELGGAFIQLAGQVFPQFRRDVHVRTRSSHQVLGDRGDMGRWAGQRDDDASQQFASAFKQRLGGIDFGGVSPTALVACGLDGGGRAWAFAEFYKHECSFETLVEAMAEMGEQHGIKRWVADPSGKKEIEKLRNAGFRVSPARHGNRINLRYQILSARLNVGADKLPGAFVTPECPNLITEIEGLSWTRRRAGVGKEEFTGNWDVPDHAVDAWTNVLADLDAVLEPFKRPYEPVQLYEGVAR